MRKADLYDQMVSSGRLDAIEKRLIAVEEFAENMAEALKEAENDKANVPKTFGGDSDG
jgi:F0F1-type ATP synthase gamma subunit